jgi:hypothetical protein
MNRMWHRHSCLCASPQAATASGGRMTSPNSSQQKIVIPSNARDLLFSIRQGTASAAPKRILALAALAVEGNPASEAQ